MDGNEVMRIAEVDHSQNSVISELRIVSKSHKAVISRDNLVMRNFDLPSQIDWFLFGAIFVRI